MCETYPVLSRYNPRIFKRYDEISFSDSDGWNLKNRAVNNFLRNIWTLFLLMIWYCISKCATTYEFIYSVVLSYAVGVVFTPSYFNMLYHILRFVCNHRLKRRALKSSQCVGQTCVTIAQPIVAQGKFCTGPFIIIWIRLNIEKRFNWHVW